MPEIQPTTKLTFDHIARETTDIAGTVAWYRDNLPGIEVLYEDETWAFLDACGTKLAFVTPGQHPPHLAWRVSNTDLEQLAARHHCEIKPHRDGTRSFYLPGPAGDTLEIIAYPDDNPDSHRE
jgi:catechol 2,3-dioxygenase-like lactoylglutathione lyase family enzyme